MQTSVVRCSASRASTYRSPPLEMEIDRPARACFELFCDVTRSRKWVSVLRAVRVYSRTSSGRPREVSFLASLNRATIGYTLSYLYRERDLRVAWSTHRHATVRISGWARFRAATTPGQAVLTYALCLDLGAAMSEWREPAYARDPRLAVVVAFRDFAHRAIRKR